MKNSPDLPPDQLVYREMFEAILAQRLLPGTKLTEDNIAKIFDVSRTVVRRALLRLSHDGIVDIQPNRGASVVRPSIKQAREILRARQLIEGTIAKEAATSASKHELDELRALVEEEHSIANGNRGKAIRISGDFHLKLAEIAGDTTLANILTRLVPQTSLIIAQYEKPGLPNCSHEDHFGLIDAIAKGDGNHAAELMSTHLCHIENKLLLKDEDAPADLDHIFAHISKAKKSKS